MNSTNNNNTNNNDNRNNRQNPQQPFAMFHPHQNLEHPNIFQHTGQVRIQVNLPQLKPEPAPEKSLPTNNNNGTAADNNKPKRDINPKYDCAICFDIIDDPCECPNKDCKTKFCYSCLLRVYQTSIHQQHQQQQQRQGQHQPPTKAKCPMCRSEFQMTEISRDERLMQEMHAHPPLQCSNPGCTRLIPLSILKKHESMECDYLHYKCKYAPWGCKWVGPKLEIANHEKNECQFEKVKGLVQTLRESMAMQKILMKNMSMMGRQMNFHHEAMHYQFHRSVSDPICLLQLGFLCLVKTSPFIRHERKYGWKSMVDFLSARASVFNFYYFLPTVLFLAKEFIYAMKLFLDIFISGLQVQNKLHAFYSIYTSIVLTTAGIILLMFYFFDRAQPTQWTSHRIAPTWSTLVYRNVVASGLVVIYFVAMITDGKWKRVCSIMTCLLILTTLFPPILSQIFCKIAEPPTLIERQRVTAQDHEKARGRQVVIFGLRYGIHVILRGPVSMFDSIVISRITGKIMNIPSKVEDCECYLKIPELQHWIAIGLVRLVSNKTFLDIVSSSDILSISSPQVIVAMNYARHVVISLIILFAVNHTVYALEYAGKRIGISLIFKVLAQNNNTRNPTVSTLIGTLTFSLYTLLLFLMLNI